MANQINVVREIGAFCAATKSLPLSNQLSRYGIFANTSASTRSLPTAAARDLNAQLSLPATEKANTSGSSATDKA